MSENLKSNPNKLRESLILAIDNVNKQSNTAIKEIKLMAQSMYNMSGGEIMYVLNGRTPVDILSDDSMYKVSRVLFEYLKNNSEDFNYNKIDVNYYYHDYEKEQYETKIDRTLREKDIVKEHYIPLANDQISISFSNKEIRELIDSNQLLYNPETQRRLTVIETEQGTIKKVTINDKSYGNIIDSMLRDEYIPDTLTFNINPDISESYFQIIDNKLIIPYGVTMDCIDGYHRVKAAVAATKLNEDWDINFPVILTSFDIDKAKKFILQEDKKTHLSKEQVLEDNQDDAANFIISKFQNSYYLKDFNIQDIKYSLNKIITSIFKPKELTNIEAKQEALSLFKLIEKDLNILIEDNMLIGKSFTKEEWFIYLYLVKHCRDYKKNFITTLNKIDVDSLLKEISVTNEPSPKQFKRMKEVLKNV